MTPHPYQAKSIERLSAILAENHAAIDASDPGVGKTLVGVEVMKRLNRQTLVVCPKAVIPGWDRTAAAQGTELSTLNYEMLRTGNTPYGEWRGPDIYHDKDWFRWHPAVHALIFDEGHRCRGQGTKNSLMLKAARRQNIPTLVLSATLADSPMELDALGYLLRLHDSDMPPTVGNPRPTSFYDWARGFGCGGSRPFHFLGGTEDMKRMNALLYPRYGVRVTIPELGDQFPENQTTAELYDIDDPDRMRALQAEMAEALAELKARTSRYGKDPMAIIAAVRQKAELMKVPVFVSVAQDLIAQGTSVAMFVNYRCTQEAILERMGSDCRIDGSQIGPSGATMRERCRSRFQDNYEHSITCISEAGGVGLDMQDIHGVRPVASLVSSGYCAKIFTQVLGRIRRSGGKSKAIQRVIFVTGEESQHRTISRKLANLEAFNDGDFNPKILSLTKGEFLGTLPVNTKI